MWGQWVKEWLRELKGFAAMCSWGCWAEKISPNQHKFATAIFIWTHGSLTEQNVQVQFPKCNCDPSMWGWVSQLQFSLSLKPTGTIVSPWWWFWKGFEVPTCQVWASLVEDWLKTYEHHQRENAGLVLLLLVSLLSNGLCSPYIARSMVTFVIVAMT